MVDAVGIPPGTGAKAIGLLNATSYYVILLGLAAAVIGLLLYVRYKRSFNWKVRILRPTGRHGQNMVEENYMGRQLQGKGQEVRFEIWKAKKFRLQYNGEAIDSRFRQVLNNKGKIRYEVWMMPDSENWLHPVELVPHKEIVKVKKNVDGKEVMVEEVVYGLSAIVSNADRAYGMADLEKQKNKLIEPDFMAKNGAILFVILFIIAAGLYWYGGSKYSKGSETIAAATEANTVATTRLADVMINVFGNNSKPAAPTSSGIAVINVGG